MKRRSDIRDPIHGYLFISELEKDIIDTAPVQRLRRIKQLAGAHLTYPGAEHSRFCHSLGVMHLAGTLANNLLHRNYLTEDEVQKVRIATLLHDVGHGPFSHMYEEVLSKYRDTTHEDIAEWLIRKSEIKDILKMHGYSVDEISTLAVGRCKETKKQFLNQIISSPFDVDKMDYLLRDSYFTGVEYGKVDVNRILNSFDVVDKTLAIDQGASYALEAFIIARYEMFKAVYYHHSVRAAELMIIRAMDYANNVLGLTDFNKPHDFLRLEDESVLLDLLTLRDEKEKKLNVAYRFAEMFRNRQLIKRTYEVIIHRHNSFFTSLLSREDIRQKIAEEISNEAGTDPDYTILDVPTVPSVPYYLGRKGASFKDIPVFSVLPDGSKALLSLPEISHLVAELTGYMDIIRVYSLDKDRDKVRQAAEKTFGKRPYSTKVSM